jgi:hypothetical protein
MKLYEITKANAEAMSIENASPERKGHILSAWNRKHTVAKGFAKSSKFDGIRGLKGGRR